MRSQLSSSNVRYTKSEVEDFAKFSGLLVAAGGISVVYQQQAVYGVLIVLNVLAGLTLADFSAGLYKEQEIDQGITYVWMNPAYFRALKLLLQIQQLSFVAALIALLIVKGKS